MDKVGLDLNDKEIQGLNQMKSETDDKNRHVKSQEFLLKKMANQSPAVRSELNVDGNRKRHQQVDEGPVDALPESVRDLDLARQGFKE